MIFSRWRTPREFRPSPSPFASLRIGLVSDNLTRECLRRECTVVDLTPDNYREAIADRRLDLVLVESCWNGFEDSWRYGIAAYPDVPERHNGALSSLVATAREAGIPAIFWNREDGVHFDRFIASATLFDRVLTVDETMLPAYRDALGSDARLGVMMFAASRFLHQPRDVEPQRRAAFVGSYSTHLHDERRRWQDDMFRAAEPLGLTIHDRNSGRKADRYRFPERAWIDVRPAVSPLRIPAIFRRHAINLNVNTMRNSPTAFSRRLVEILACGALALSNDSLAVRRLFADHVETTDDPAQARGLFERIALDGLSGAQEEMRRAAAHYVHQEHSWTNRLEQVVAMAGA